MTPHTATLQSSRFRDRSHFAALVRRARREGTLLSYDRDLRLGRCAQLVNGAQLTYEPAWRSMLERERDEDDGLTYADPRDEQEERRGR